MLGSMKPIKISGMTNIIASNVQGERVQELQISRPFFTGTLSLNGLGTTMIVLK